MSKVEVEVEADGSIFAPAASTPTFKVEVGV
jgi:hypothetical protein